MLNRLRHPGAPSPIPLEGLCTSPLSAWDAFPPGVSMAWSVSSDLYLRVTFSTEPLLTTLYEITPPPTRLFLASRKKEKSLFLASKALMI